MDRSRTSAQTFALGSLLAGALLTIVFATSAASTTGCSTVETRPAPDAALPPCNRGPFTFFCQAPASGQPRCSTSSSSNSPVLSRLPQNTDYPVGCVVNFVGARDEQGDCRLEAVCKCVIGEIPTPEPEAGTPTETDAGDGDAEAGAQPQPQPPTTGPVWLCDE